jgi:hypothetical protein
MFVFYLTMPDGVIEEASQSCSVNYPFLLKPPNFALELTPRAIPWHGGNQLHGVTPAAIRFFRLRRRARQPSRRGRPARGARAQLSDGRWADQSSQTSQSRTSTLATDHAKSSGSTPQTVHRKLLRWNITCLPYLFAPCGVPVSLRLGLHVSSPVIRSCRIRRVSIAAEQDTVDLIVELYKRDVDRTLIRENLRKSPEDRLRALQELQRFAEEVRKAGVAMRQRQ